ncbi:MAG: hypothetical protein LBK03_00485 [Bacteroidales bacterium]|jgi:hypothetical protein|nr:hypothetical protein [Bacteroidales bacterium]
MKKYIFRRNTILLLLAGLFIGATGCRKENFNFSHLASIEAHPDYGLPFGTVRYGIGEILTQFDKEGFIEQTANGDLLYNYTITKDTVILGSNILKYKPANGTFGPFATNVTVPGSVAVSVNFEFPITLHDSNLIYSNIDIRSGMVDLTVHTSITTPCTIVFELPTVTRNGAVFSQTIHISSGNQATVRIDLTGCKIQATSDPNTIPCQGTATFDVNSAITNYSFNGIYTTSEIKLSHFDGTMTPRADNLTENYSFDLLSSLLSSPNYGASAITLYNPTVTLNINNTFHVSGQFQLQQLALASADNSLTSPLLSAPATITQPYSPTMQKHVLDNIVPQVPVRPEYNTIHLEGTSILNPNGLGTPVSIDESSVMNIKLEISIPFKLKVENAYFRDTLKLNFTDLTDNESVQTLKLINAVENLTLDIVLANTLPIGFRVQALLCDSTGLTIDSLFKGPQLLPACFNSNTPRKATFSSSMGNSKAHRLLKSKQLILRFQMDTEHQTAILNASQYLQATLRGRIKCNLGELNLTFLSTLY